ncbi:MAG: tRNA pseudouridine(55) synthase TruB, partial [Deltaproteobacteria bacterium]|nr:tRNA pseudouridine(55) synthase TruB [Deltaproteobacteria bacterium]
DKAYVATMRLGVSTDTQDYHGKMLYERPWHHISQSHFIDVCNQFVGTIDQVPPMFSAIKQNGQPLYRLARKGIEVERQARQVQIREIRLETFEPPDIIFSVVCSKGTYIRTLAHDIGEKLGCGAHLTQLRRTRSGHFDEKNCLELSRFKKIVEEKQIIPLISPADILPDWPGLQVKGEALKKLKNGIAPTSGEFNDICAINESGHVKFLDGKRLVAVAKYMPHDGLKHAGDFEILKVFPEVSPER